jgi:hypothetical protein
VVCPVCRGRLATLVARCATCGASLAALVAVKDLADRRFNEAVRAARDRRWDEAAEALTATLALDPADTEAAELLRKVHYHRKRAQARPRQAGAPKRGRCR